MSVYVDALVFLVKLGEIVCVWLGIAAVFAVLWVTLGVIEYAAPEAGA